MGVSVRIVVGCILWIVLWLLGTGFNLVDISLTASLLDIYYMPIVGIMITIINIINPSIIDMGVAKFKDANLYDRLFPLGLVALLLYLSTFFTPTVVIASVNSYYLGVAVGYITKVLWSQMRG